MTDPLCLKDRCISRQWDRGSERRGAHTQQKMNQVAPPPPKKLSSSIKVLIKYYLVFKNQGPVVQRPISDNPGLNFNSGLFFFSSKAFSLTIFSILFRVANHQIVDKRN